MPKYDRVSVAEATDRLRRDLPPGTVVYTNVEHVSRSGMVRDIRAFLHTPDGIAPITNSIALVLGRDVKNNGVRCHGVGMDMGFEMVYNLGLALHGDGYSLTQRWL